MEDDEIVALYLQRDESAIAACQVKYGRYLAKIACNILSDPKDAEECVNEAYFRAWSSIPPHVPTSLAPYLGRIIRQLSIDVFRTRHREKRYAAQYALALSELDECLSGGDVTQETADANLLAAAIASFLRTLPQMNRAVFLCRYYYMDPIQDIAQRCGMTSSGVKSLLHRTRLGLKAYLVKEGFSL